MEKKNIITTKVWKINDQLVVANTIEEAIEVYKTHLDFPYNEIKSINAVTDGGIIGSNSALMFNSSFEDDMQNPEVCVEKNEFDDEWEPKSGDIVCSKEDNGTRFYISKNENSQHPCEEWLLSEIRDNGFAGGFIDSYTLKTKYKLVERPEYIIYSEHEDVKNDTNEEVGMIFKLTPDQVKQYNAFCEKHCHKDVEKGAIGGHISIRFNQTGLGSGVTLHCGVCDETKDITDYDCW